MSVFDDLHRSIQMRPRPEDVAQLVLEILDDKLTRGQKGTLDVAARYSLKRGAYSYSSMKDEFERIVGADRIVARTAEIFKVPSHPTASQCIDPAFVESFLEELLPQIKATMGNLNLRTDRLPREQRRAIPNFPAKRRYNRMFRAAKRLSEKLEKMVENTKKYRATRIAKSAGATLITVEELSKDLGTACFVAYLSARMNLRSMFSGVGQDPSFDNIAQMLLKNAIGGCTPNWYAIAMVHPEAEILKNLTEEQKGLLLGIWTQELSNLADMLEELARTNNLDLNNCIVHKGNDSTTWNAVAGAWNKARDAWMGIIHSLGMESILDHYCPGKALRLMASDVVQWQMYMKTRSHSWNQDAVDAALHPDTLVWRALPKPWEVFKGKATCTRAQVQAACDKVYHDRPEKGMGWYTMKAPKHATTFKPTPELVHGVTVTSPYLASVLKDAGWFSGKGIKETSINATVIRDEAGAVVLVQPGAETSAEPGLVSSFLNSGSAVPGAST